MRLAVLIASLVAIPFAVAAEPTKVTVRNCSPYSALVKSYDAGDIFRAVPYTPPFTIASKQSGQATCAESQVNSCYLDVTIENSATSIPHASGYVCLTTIDAGPLLIFTDRPCNC